MLRKILPLFFCIALSLTHEAQAVLFSAPEADSIGFQKMAVQKNQQTYTQWFFENHSQSAAEAHEQVLNFSQRALQIGASKQILNEWDLLRQSLELNSADREVLFLLAEKLKITQELCRYVILDPSLESLLENPRATQSCQQKAQPVPAAFLKQLSNEDILVIDGKAFSKERIPAKIASGSYRWKVISNTYEDYGIQTTVNELGKQQISRQAWVQGTCDNYKLNHKDFSMLVQAQIYFKDSCVVPGVPPEKNLKTWAKENKTLLWGLGIIAAGFAAYQLRDKTLVVTMP